MATAEKRKRSEEHGIWDHFIKNPLDGSKPTCRKCRQFVSRGSSTSKAKSWGKWAFVDSSESLWSTILFPNHSIESPANVRT
jgi:hypothetical protein